MREWRNERLTVIATLLLLAWPQGAWAGDPAAMCAAETARQERAAGIPVHLLTAISKVESGRWDEASRATLAWPWTVTAEGRGRFLPNKAAAIAEVMALKAQGVRNIDVGCMQVNLHHHPDAFADLNQAFDPVANVGYAVRFLTSLHAASGSWQTAASHYHSQTPELAARYRAKVVAAWTAERQGAAPEAVPVLAATTQAPRQGKAAAAAAVAEREAARRAAQAYREARLAEYRQRMQEVRRDRPS